MLCIAAAPQVIPRLPSETALLQASPTLLILETSFVCLSEVLGSISEADRDAEPHPARFCHQGINTEVKDTDWGLPGAHTAARGAGDAGPAPKG